MIRKWLRYMSDNINNAMHYLKWLLNKRANESVYFYTFHKCASSLFGGYVLKNVQGLRHIDYASKIYVGIVTDDVTFKDNGFIYGPLRLSLRHSSPEYTKLVRNVSNPEFVRRRIAVFLIRDPRDILVSKYFSFGFTHDYSRVKEIRKMQQQIRSDIQGKSIDQYCIDEAPRTLVGFDTLRNLSQSSSRSVVLKYEDMIENWTAFSVELTKYIHIENSVLKQLYERSRPMEKENLASHRRDGSVGSFRNKLQEDTIKYLNKIFKDVLEEHQYLF